MDGCRPIIGLLEWAMQLEDLEWAKALEWVLLQDINPEGMLLDYASGYRYGSKRGPIYPIAPERVIRLDQLVIQLYCGVSTLANRSVTKDSTI